jgi:hypothetical protein
MATIPLAQYYPLTPTGELLLDAETDPAPPDQAIVNAQLETEILAPPPISTEPYSVNVPGAAANPNGGATVGNSAAGSDIANMASAVTTPATGAQAAGSALSAANAGTGVTGDNTTIGKFETWLTSSTGNIVAVLLGLILIAGAIFSFSAVKDTVVGAGKAIVT